MKKRILSCLMALALCLTLLPTAALAEETEGTAQTPPAVEKAADPANGEAKQESQPAETKQENQPAEAKQENQPVEAKQEGQSAEAKQENQPAEQGEQQEDSAAKQAVADVQAMIDALPDAEALDGMDDEDAMAVYEAFQAACDAYYDLTEEQQAQLKNTEKLEALSDWFSQLETLAAGTGHTHPICGDKDCSEHGKSISDWVGVSTLTAEMEAGHYYLTDYVTIYSTWKPKDGVVLCLNGYGITLDADGPVIEVQPGATFTLCDCKGDGNGGSITHNRRSNYRCGIGVIVGALDSVENSAVFNMYGGTISGNEAPRGDEADGGGVTVGGGTFNLYGGTISNNMACSGKAIGGGVFIGSLGTFNMTGGTITENQADSGGGVFVGGYYGKVKDDEAKYGGTFNMTGGEITGNTSGGGVHVNYYPGAIFKVSGTAKITDNAVKNVYLSMDTSDGKKTYAPPIEVGTLDSTASIGVTTADAGQTVAKGVSEAAAKRFNSDSSKYRLIYDSGERTLTMATAAHSAHPICGDVNCSEHGESFSDWQGVSKLSDISKAGNYYLTQNVEITSTWKPVNGVVLCLNGYDITANGDFDAITIEGSRTFTLCDCFGGGKITHAKGKSGTGVLVMGTGDSDNMRKACFNMYGGTITGNAGHTVTVNSAASVRGGGVYIEKGMFEMHGGTISDNTGADGGGVYVGGTFNMYGGKITGNSAKNGGGVYYTASNSLFVSGKVNITGNKDTSGADSNVYVPSSSGTPKTVPFYIGDDGLDTAAEIGVRVNDGVIATGEHSPVAQFGTYADATSAYHDGNFLADNGGDYGFKMAAREQDTITSRYVVNLYNGLHDHPICGETCEDGANHGEQTWKPVSSLDEITKEGNYYLTQSVAINSTWEPVDGVVLCLNGNYIEMKSDGDVITVNNGVKFTLCDCKGGGTGGGAVMHSGSLVNGHGVVIRAGGTFSLYNAKICDNQSGDVSNGSVGAGVYVNGGTFHMYSGSISGNTALRNGGGVYVDGDTGKFTMSGGTIEGNTSSGENYGEGGGVYINGGTFTMTGGSITNNISRNDGGGVCVWENATAFTVSGKVNITGNTSNKKNNAANDVYLFSGKSITVDGKLDSTAKIGVTCAGVATGTSVTVATGGADSCTEDNFTANAGGAHFIKVEQDADANSVNVNLYNGLPHVHPICGAAHKDIGDHTGTCGDVTWMPWDGTSAITYDSENTAYVYLTGNVERSVLTVAKGYKLYLCLNGHSLTGTKTGKNVIHVESGATLTLCDCSEEQTGKITHGTNGSGQKYTGRGVTVEGTFNMYGGSITGNDTTSTGGGVSLPYGAYSARFNLYGGSITNNTANNGGDGGGGVHILSGYFTMYDGRITENQANGANFGGGGVYLSETGSFIMKGGSITNNTAKNGGGVFTSVNLSTGLTVSGDVTITGNKNADDKAENVYLVNGKTIEIAGALTGGPASIGVTTADGVAAKNYVTIAKGGSGHTTLTKDDLNAFTSDNTAYGKLLLGNSVVFTNGDLHTHPICGKTCADGKHTDKIWQGVSSLDAITEAGYYYLTQNVMVKGETWKPAKGVVLCLNGHIIAADGSFDAISVDTGVTFTLTDCKPEGTAGRITHRSNSNGERYIGRGVDVSGTFNLYDGSIADNDTGKLGNPGGGVGVADGGTFRMYGGKITGNTALSGGGVDLSGGTFNMTGGEITGNTTYGTENNGGGGVHVSKGTFTMSGNAVISGNTANGSGGGVCVTDGGTFTMEGGTIGGDTANGNTASGRGGGGVYVYNSTFTMKNGTISGNSADDSNGGDGNGGGVYANGSCTFTMSGNAAISGNTAAGSYGGGVYMDDFNGQSIFTMSDNAAISGNTAKSNGGGVCVKYGTFTMNGGTISGNKATGLNGNGGGVYVASLDNTSSKFIMNSGTISGNTASDYGGGVYVYSTTELGGTFTMNGGTITGNNGTYDGGGVYVGKMAKMTVSGGARIEDNWKKGTLNEGSGVYEKGDKGSANNLYLYSVAIGTLAGTAHIGITTAKTPTAGAPVQFATGATNAALDYTTIFIPDAADQGYVVNKDESGNLFLNAHRHNWTYTANGATITAKCDATDCTNRDGGSVKISASDAAYDRSAKAATVTASNDWKGDAVDSIAVKYTGREGTAYNSTEAPTNAGKYTASITLGEGGNAKTASVEYEITKATPQASDFNITLPVNPVYDGNQHGAVVAVKDGITGMGEITATKYYINANGQMDPVKVNRYEVRINVAEGANYTAATEVTDGLSWSFTIGKGTQTVHVPAGKTIVKNGIAMDISDWASVTGVENGETPGALSYALDGSYPGVTLTEGKLTVQQIVAKGTVITIKATAAATDDYNEASETFTVTVADKQPVNLSVSMDNWTYGGTANEPRYDASEGVTATVTYAKADGTALSERPTDAGSYTVTVSYETDTEIRTGTANFTISKREVAVPTADPTQFEYTGQEQTYVLGNFADAAYYTVSGAMKRTNAGSQNVTVQLKDKNNTVWKGGTDADKTYVFTIAPKPLSKVTIGDFPDKTYTGLSIQPVVVPADGNTALTKDRDYTVSYGANTNVGKATIRVTGTGNYTGTVSKEWNITPAVLTISDVTVADKTYNGSADATVTAVAFDGLKNGEKLVIGTDYEVIGAAFNDENVDTANKVTGTVALKGTEKAKNYTLSSAAFEQEADIGQADYNGTASKTVNIVKGRSTVQTGTLTAADFFPDGQMPAGAKITDWSLTSHPTAILSAVDVGGGKLTYLSAKNIATASEESGRVTIATTNYKDITATLTFQPTDKLVQDGFKFENGSVTKTYGDGDFTLTTTGKVEGSTVTYESNAPAVATVDGTGKVTIKGAGTAVITAKASATEDYDGAAVTCTLTVEKKPIAIPAADATAFTYNGTEQTYALAEDGAYTITGNKQTNANETGYSVTAALKDTANTQWADGTTADKTYTFVIGKAVITVKAKDQTAYVGDKAPTLGADSCTVSGLVGEEKLTTQPTVKYVGADGKEITPDMTKTGEVKILAGGAAASDNYTIRYEDGKLTVSTRPSGGGGSSRPSTHPVKAEVSKDPDGTVSLSKTSAAKGDKVTITVKPERHYEVDEVIVRDSKGKQLAVKDNGDGTFTFEMPADKVTVEPTFTWVNPFADVANSAYYVDAVEWMLKREVTQGTTETTFSPNLNCTRAQIVTFLWRAAGSPEPKGTVSFADVSADSYYAKAVAWAVENGITGGTGDGLFSPDATCTRAQSAAFLYRAAGSPAVNGNAGFSDVAADAYYAQAVAWAKEDGITDGIGGGLFGSANDCTRAQIAAFLWRLYAKK